MSSSSQSLGERLAQPDILVAPGVYDALTALMAEQAGFEAVYLSGASIAYTRFGRPDIGLVSMAEVIDTIVPIRERVSLPIIADADTGYGNALNVIRTVKEFERAGADAIQLEDQASPKRCGHLAGKSLIDCAEMVGKIRAAVDARRNPDTVLLIRTDAIAVEGFECALDRAERYLEAGADALFVEAPTSLEQMREITARFAGRVPLLANMVEGGKTPVLSAAELQEIGYALTIFPGGTVRTIAHVLGEYFARLQAEGGTASWRNRMLDFNGLNDIIGTPEMLALGQRYESTATPSPDTRPAAGED